MASLSIEIDKAARSRSVGGGLVAELDFVGAPTRVARGRPRKVSVSTRAKKIVDDLSPGLWEIRIIMPSGKVLSQEVELVESSQRPVRFVLTPRKARKLPEPTRAPPAQQRAPSIKSVALDFGARVLRSGGGLISGFSTMKFGSNDAGRVEQSLETAVSILDAPARQAGDDVSIAALWAGYAKLVDGTDAAEALNAKVCRDAIRIADDDVGNRWDPAVPRHVRAFALTASAAGRRLHSLPAPWRLDGPDVPVLVEENGGATRVVVEDDAYAGLLSYLASGSVVTAVELLTADDELEAYTGLRAERALRDKRASPLGACAAAYALLGSSRPGPEEPWHPWIANLESWFPDIPDGAVLNARLKLMRASSDEDGNFALVSIREALARGLPHYRQGLDWLLQAMMYFADDELVTRLRPMVSKVASGLAMGEVFTTLELKERGA